MKIKNIISSFSIILLISPTLFAQKLWENNPKIHNVDAQYNKESLLIILDSREINYEVNEKTKKYYIVRKSHRIIKMMDEKGVESQNKIIIPTDYDTKILKMKFRLIKPNGIITEVDQKDIKSSIGENGYIQYHIAYENAAIGDEIEYYVEEENGFSAFGGENLQFSVPVLKSSISIAVPTGLSIQCKSLNGYPELKTDTVEEIVYHKAEHKNIPALEDEKYADPKLYMLKMNYKLIGSENTGNIPLYTWNDFAKQRFNYIYDITDKEKKALQKYIASLNINNNWTVEEKVIALEKVLKEQILVNEELEDPKYTNIDFLLEKKTTYKQGYLKLWANALDMLEIKHEVGFGNNKFENVLDEKFAYWNHLETYLIYVTATKQYILPLDQTVRYPALTPMTEGSKGIFLKRLSANNITTASPTFRNLPTTPFDLHNHDLDIEVNINNENIPHIKVKNIFTGLSANGYREIGTYIKKEDEKKFITSLIDYVNEEKDILNYQFINRGLEHYSDNKPLIIEAEVLAPDLLEKAGEKFLFKLGNIIGRQEELYQENKRQLPISMPFAHALKREIKINIPKGYKVVNPTVVDKSLVTKGKYGFESTHKLTNDQMSITVYEFYQEATFPPEEYESFRKVINAAADFNKVTLILEKI